MNKDDTMVIRWAQAVYCYLKMKNPKITELERRISFLVIIQEGHAISPEYLRNNFCKDDTDFLTYNAYLNQMSGLNYIDATNYLNTQQLYYAKNDKTALAIQKLKFDLATLRKEWQFVATQRYILILTFGIAILGALFTIWQISIQKQELQLHKEEVLKSDTAALSQSLHYDTASIRIAGRLDTIAVKLQRIENALKIHPSK